LEGDPSDSNEGLNKSQPSKNASNKNIKKINQIIGLGTISEEKDQVQSFRDHDSHNVPGLGIGSVALKSPESNGVSGNGVVPLPYDYEKLKGMNKSQLLGLKRQSTIQDLKKGVSKHPRFGPRQSGEGSEINDIDENSKIGELFEGMEAGNFAQDGKLDTDRDADPKKLARFDSLESPVPLLGEKKRTSPPFGRSGTLNRGTTILNNSEIILAPKGSFKEFRKSTTLGSNLKLSNKLAGSDSVDKSPLKAPVATPVNTINLEHQLAKNRLFMQFFSSKNKNKKKKKKEVIDPFKKAEEKKYKRIFNNKLDFLKFEIDFQQKYTP
jgi:hypothetical protein